MDCPGQQDKVLDVASPLPAQYHQIELLWTFFWWYVKTEFVYLHWKGIGQGVAKNIMEKRNRGTDTKTWKELKRKKPSSTQEWLAALCRRSVPHRELRGRWDYISVPATLDDLLDQHNTENVHSISMVLPMKIWNKLDYCLDTCHLTGGMYIYLWYQLIRHETSWSHPNEATKQSKYSKSNCTTSRYQDKF